MKKIRYIISAVFLFLFVVFSGFISAKEYVVRADETSVFEFDKTNVLDDLEKSLITGKEFSLKDFGFDETKSTQVISFLEYRYSFYEARQSDFGLYVYVYNPKGLSFEVNSSLHTISFKIGEEKEESYSKYSLSVVSVSQGDYLGLFYKFKVKLTDEQRQDILSKVNSTERVYSVSEVELFKKNDTNATSIPAQGVYKFSGYMSGYGSDSSAENTLKCMNEQLETLSLDVHPTTYRPEGTNGKNDFTQDSLHSVYFAVPNKFIDSYGEMTAVHATWLNALLAPALVTGNQEAYAAIEKFLGQYRNIIIPDESMYPSLDSTLPYVYLGDFDFNRDLQCWTMDYSFNFDAEHQSLGCVLDHTTYERKPVVGRNVDILYMIFNAGEGDDSADTYICRSEDIQEKLKEGKEKFGGELVNDKYARCMFDSVDEKFTEMTIYRDDDFSLTNEVVGSSWWDRLWGITTTTTFDGIKGIHTVSDSDFTGDIVADCNSLYIGRQDYLTFRQYYEFNKKDSTVYLFRYQVSEYVAQEASLKIAESSETWGDDLSSNIDSNAYFFQETVNLDFDIIDVTFSTGEEETIIPVVMSPIDVIPDATPPVYTESDNDDEWWEKIVMLLGLLILAVVIGPFIGPILTALFSVLGFVLKMVSKALSLPFKMLGSGKRRR